MGVTQRLGTFLGEKFSDSPHSLSKEWKAAVCSDRHVRTKPGSVGADQRKVTCPSSPPLRFRTGNWTVVVCSLILPFITLSSAVYGAGSIKLTKVILQ